VKFARDDARVGLLVVTAALIFGGILFQRSLRALFKKETPIQVRLENVSDLVVGTEVHLQGLRVGQVNAIEPTLEGVQYHFVASLGISPTIVLWKGTRGVVVSKLLGGAYLDLQLPDVNARTQVLEPGAILEGDTAGSLPMLIDQMQDFVRNLNGALTDLRGSFKEKGLGAIFDHPDIKKALKDLDATLLQAQALILAGQHTVKGVDEALGRDLASLEKSLTIIHGLLEKRGGDIDEILVNLSIALKQFNALSTEARAMLKADGPEFEATLKALNRNLRSTEDLVEILKAKPNRLVWGKPSEKEKEEARRKVQAARSAEQPKP